MIQINAASRLVQAASADEQKTRKYLESLGVKVGDVSSNRHGRIVFKLKAADASAAVASVTKALGKKPQVTNVQGGKIYVFDAGQKRQISVETSKARAFISLFDENAID